MAKHVISIHSAGASRKVSLSEVPIQAGDELVFTAETNAASILCFGPETAEIISHGPSASNLDIAGGTSLTLSIGALAAGGHTILIQAHGWPCPTKIPFTPGGVAKIEIRPVKPADFPGPDDIPVGTDG